MKSKAIFALGAAVLVGCAHSSGFPLAVVSPPARLLPEVLPDLILPQPDEDSPPLVFLSPQPATPEPPLPSEASGAEQFILEQTNRARGEVGAKPLIADPEISRIARSRSLDLGTRNYFGHVNPDGKTALDLLREAGIQYGTAGENIGRASGSPSGSAESIFGMWMNSAGHKANILNRSYGRIGVGAAQIGSTAYFTQIFAD